MTRITETFDTLRGGIWAYACMLEPFHIDQGIFKENLQLHNSPSLPSLPIPSFPSSSLPSLPILAEVPGVWPPAKFLELEMLVGEF